MRTSLQPKFPDNRENNREFCRFQPFWGDFGAQLAGEFNSLQPNSLRIGTGNFCDPNRELLGT
jgi:hypothetical protein